MKPHIALLCVTSLLVVLPGKSAQADDEAVAALGGFVAGIITGSIIDHDRGGRTVYVGVDSRHRDKYHSKGYRDHSRYRGYRDYPARDYGHGKKRGHWETRRIRVWVPGYWRTTRNDCGDRIKVWERGHFVWKREKVWVSYRERRGGICYQD